MGRFGPGVGIRPRRPLAAGTPAPPPPAPVTQAFGYAAVAAGWTLLTDATSTPGKHYALSSQSQAFASVWAGIVTGSAARVRVAAEFNVNAANLISISIDGGPWALSGAADGAGDYTLFSGLTDVPHFVQFKFPNNQYSYMPTSGTVLRVTGAAPAVAPAGEWQVAGDASAKAIKASGLEPSQAEGSYLAAGRTPMLRPTPSFSTGRVGISNHISFRTASPEVWIVSQCRYVFLWDGTGVTEYDTGQPLGIGIDAVRVKRITGLSGTRTYMAWGGTTTGTPVGGWAAVGVPAGQSFLSIAGTPSAHLFGDSITQGVDPTAAGNHERVTGHVELIRAFAARGYAVGNWGVAGQTTAGLNAMLDATQPLVTVGANDVAHVAIGQNDSAVPPAELTALVGKLLAKGYRRVIVRGVLPVVNDGHIAKNTAIQAALPADVRVRYLDPNGWSEVRNPGAGLRDDGIHFTPAGYDLLLARMTAALPGLLA